MNFCVVLSMNLSRLIEKMSEITLPDGCMFSIKSPIQFQIWEGRPKKIT